VACPGPSGPGAARNEGARKARGEILFFVDADIVVHPDTLPRVAADFECNGDPAAVFGSYDDSPAAQNFLSQYRNLLHHFVHQDSKTEAVTFWGGCGAVRKEIFDKLGGFDQCRYPTASIEDIELGYRMHQAGYRILLDKELQVQHLKEWRLGSLLRADIYCRAVPWSKLILERQGLINDLNLQTRQRISTGLTGLAAVLLPFGFVSQYLAYSLLLSLVMIVILNRKMYLFFLRQRGVAFTLCVFPMHLLFYLYSGVTFALCWYGHVYRPKGGE
jgi:cellulose synthase/poly-beta-1,6-N-acetylglucosamine synthase-like glycosyltransferase